MKAKIAHVEKTEDGIIVQDLKDHLLHVAALCRGYMERMGCPAMGYLVGLFHDAGKAGASFQNRMEAIASGQPDPGQKGGHASAGAVLLHRLGGEQGDMSKRYVMQAMCEAIFSHHAALPDNISPEGEDGYKARMRCDESEFQEIQEYFLREIISREELGRLLRQACKEAETLIRKIKAYVGMSRQEFEFFLGLAEKMLLSALIDADWLDSATCGESELQDFEETLRTEIEGKENHADRRELFTYFLENLENTLETMGRPVKPINAWRNYISDKCKEAGDRKGGVYTLSCPTGAGKTLAVTRFALTHCIRRDKGRIFYIIPYLSIIDQTAKSIKKALGRSDQDKQAEDNILELHSQVESRNDKEDPDQTAAEKTERSTKGDFWTQRMAEPIVLTTMVRFLNTFFAQGTRNLRPAHQFHEAVLIFDEVQTLPIRQIALFNSLINYLAEFCGCTCVLCTATQPLLGETVKPVYPVRMADPAPLVTLPAQAGEAFRRVEVQSRVKTGGYTQEELADFIWERAEESGNVLAILNTRDCALSLYREVTQRVGEEYKVYYLSTKLYAAHRKEIIDKVRKALADRERIIVISTQLIEAGIDFDFSCVIRSLAGMDSIIQAAGRCNREGLRGVEITYIVNPCEELESLSKLKDIKEGKRETYRLLEEFENNSQEFDGELLSEKAVCKYFKYYFWTRQEEMVYPLKKYGDSSLYDLLAGNRSLAESGKEHKNYEMKALNQAFRTAAEHYRVIEEGGNSVFVPRGRGKEIQEEIQNLRRSKNAEYEQIKKLLKESQQYVVNLRDNEIKELGKGVIWWENELGMYVLNEMYYDEKAGITGEIGTMPYCGF